MPVTSQTAERGAARRRVGRYVLEKKLGVGATSTAWRARAVNGTRAVCLKLLHPHLLHDPGARARLGAEAAAAAAVDHPAIVPVLDVVLTDTDAALIFPFLKGETVAARLARRGRLEPREAARIAADIAAALAAVHAQGVVHRDVKPSNILLGDDGRARLLDFGIAHQPDNGPDALVADGMTVGTLPYMSPEQLAGTSATPANDVYALGAVLYEMLAGQRPYDAATPTALAEAHVAPPADVPSAPRPLLALAWTALRPTGAARPSAADLRDALEDWLAGRTAATAGAVPAAETVAHAAIAVPVAGPPVARDRRRRHTALAGVAVAAMALVVAAAFAVWARPGGAPGTEPQHTPPTEAVGPAGLEADNVGGGEYSTDDGGRDGADQPAVQKPPAAADERKNDRDNKNDRDKGKGRERERERERGRGNDSDDDD